MPRRRRRRTTRKVAIAAAILVSTIGYFITRDSGPSTVATELPAAATGQSGIPLAGLPEASAGDPEPAAGRNQIKEGPRQQKPADLESNPERLARGVRQFELARQNDSRGDLLRARQQYSQALRIGLPPEEQEQTRVRLAQLAQQTIFGAQRHKNDPLVSTYIVQPGDTMGKIARKYKVTDDLLAKINGLKNKNLIRAGQALKVLHGPFHVEITKSRHVLDVFLQDTFIRQYDVGLGTDGSTPGGEWSISNKLINPTYYSPRGEGIIAADDPENPLGERWIGLEGVSGESVEQMRDGIHGTNNPPSIGKDESLGCVRMHNQDVEVLYDMLVETHSRIIIFD